MHKQGSLEFYRCMRYMDSKGFQLVSDITLEATIKLVFLITTLQASTM
jgi:hypothetical protein